MFSSAIERLNARRSGAGDIGEDAGFTLIELMVVLLILAILLAIAIPTFLGVTGGANDRAAQSNLNTALTNAKAEATQNNQQYVATGQTAAAQFTTLQNDEPSIKFVYAGTGQLTQGPVSVYFDNTSGSGVVLESYSKNGPTCWIVVDNLTALTITAADGAYGASAVTAGSATQAPSGAGTFFTSEPAPAGGCDSGAAIAGATVPWKTAGF